MYRRDLRDTSRDGLLSDLATTDLAVQALPEPGGDRIAYAKSREGTIDLWLLDEGRDVRLTSEGVLAMRYGRGDPGWFDWSPDGDRIAYLTAAGTAATVDVETGETTELTNYDDPDQGVAWSPDGEWIAIVTDHFSRASLAAVSPDGTRLRALADDEYLYGDPVWNGDRVVALRSTHRDLFDYEAAVVSVGLDGAERVLYHEPGVRAASPRPRPGTDEVAFVHDGTGYDGVSLVDGQGDGDPVSIYDVDGAEVADPAWSADGERLAVTVTRDAAVEVRVVDLAATGASPEVETLTDPAFVTAPRFRDGNVIATHGTPTSPPAVRDCSTGERLSPAGTAGLGERLPEPERITYESAGREIQAVVYPPAEDADPESVPVVVKAHGGPTSFDALGFDHRAAYVAALGYAVILPNYRGSDAYGREFRMANDRDWGGGDLNDVIAAADACAAEYEAVDGDRAGIYGGSGGGLMTVNALGNSDRFRAGAAFYGVYDYETFVDDTDDVGWQLMKRELGDLATDIENYREASPIRNVEAIEDPLLVLHGEDDARVPISQSEQLVEELEKHGKRYEFQRYEGEPHGFGDCENVVDAYTRVADLFAKYLRVDPDDGSSRPHHPPEEGSGAADGATGPVAATGSGEGE